VLVKWLNRLLPCFHHHSLRFQRLKVCDDCLAVLDMFEESIEESILPIHEVVQRFADALRRAIAREVGYRIYHSQSSLDHLRHGYVVDTTRMAHALSLPR